jgi:micrococcal nuclease
MYTYSAKILRVIDGDTIESEIDLGFGVSIRKTIRLNGIDAPERNSRILSERELAAKATARTKYSLENKTVIMKTQLDKDDKYGRALAYIYESEKEMEANQSFNVKLIQEGLAFPYSGGLKNAR